jgi:hypothetical protein
MNLDGGFGVTECDEARRLFTEKHLAEAETALRLKTPHEELRDELAHLLWRSLKNRSDGAPRPKETLEYLDRIKCAAADLSSLLVNLGEGSPSADEALFRLGVVGNGALDRDEVSRLRKDVASLATAARRAAAVTHPRGGPPFDVERHNVLSHFDKIVFSYVGGHRKYSYDGEYTGPLFLLLRAFENAEAAALGKSPASDAALAKFILKASPDPDKT